MTSRRNGQERWFLTALIMIVALTGLTAGALTRTLLDSGANERGRVSPSTATPTATTVTLSTPATSTATLQPTTAPIGGHFTLRLTVSPASGPAGTAITIRALVTDDATGAPIAGLTCHLRAPTDGAQGLFATWPTPTSTDDTGVALWMTRIPADAPGHYEVEVFAQTPSWSYKAHATVIVTVS